MIMYSFFDDYKFDGKNVIPFNTHEGSGDAGTYEKIACSRKKLKSADNKGKYEATRGRRFETNLSGIG